MKKIVIYLFKSMLLYNLMEINYDLIIKYLTNINNKESKNSQKIVEKFAGQKGDCNYSINFPTKFKNILTDKFYRYGVTVNDCEKNNISFWSSIMTLIDKNFIIPYSSDELELINQFKLQLIDKFSKSKLSSLIKNVDKNSLRDRFRLEQDIYTIQYIVDILDINILIFDFKTLDINCVYHEEIMNPYKKTILLAKFEKNWEPILMTKNNNDSDRLFDYNNPIINKILSTENLVSYFENEKNNKQYILNDNINLIIQKEKSKLKINDLIEEDSESSVKTDSDVVTDEIKKLNKTDLNKLKLDELQNIVNKLKITIDNKKPTKKTLIDIILAKSN
jgi:hypothetical protein